MIVRISRRVAWIVTLWLLAGFLGAVLVWMAPGFGIDERVLDPRWTKDSSVALRGDEQARLGPVSFYIDWLEHFARGDLGESNSLGRPVADLLRERLPITLRSAAAGLALGWAAGLILAVATYFIKLPGFDWLTAAVAGILLSLPSAVIAVLFVMLDAPVSWAIAAVIVPQVFSYARNLCNRAMCRTHVLMAAAKGVGSARIFFWHVLSTIGPQLLALAGVSVTLAFTAAIPIEVICDSPGVGQLAWLAAMARDLPLLVNITLIVTGITLTANSISDWATSASGIEGATR